MDLRSILAPASPELQARAAAILALFARQAIGSESYRAHLRSWTKDDRSPVTVADLLHQAQVQHLLAQQFPGDALICEEPRDSQEAVAAEAASVSRTFYGQELPDGIPHLPTSGRFTWVLDPIDGTKGYIAGRYYALAIALFVEDELEFAALAVPDAPRADDLPIRRKLAFALRGRGAWWGSLPESVEGEVANWEVLRAGEASATGPWQVALSLEHAGSAAEALEGAGVTKVRLDSQAKYLAVAAGAIDGYVRQVRSDGAGTDVTWDHAAGCLVAREAGARVRHFDGGDVRPEPDPVMRFRGGMICHRAVAGDKLYAALAAALTPSIPVSE